MDRELFDLLVPLAFVDEHNRVNTGEMHVQLTLTDMGLEWVPNGFPYIVVLHGPPVQGTPEIWCLKAQRTDTDTLDLNECITLAVLDMPVTMADYAMLLIEDRHLSIADPTTVLSRT